MKGCAPRLVAGLVLLHNLTCVQTRQEMAHSSANTPHQLLDLCKEGMGWRKQGLKLVHCRGLQSGKLLNGDELQFKEPQDNRKITSPLSDISALH